MRAPALPRLGRCPRCTFAVTRTTAVCEQCGALVPFEEAARSADPGNLAQALLGRRLSQLRAHEVALLLACIPLLIGPPVAALALVGATVLRDPSRARLPEWRRPLAIAALNILVSLVAWRYAADQAAGLASELGAWLRSLPGPAPSPGGGARITPV